MGERCCIDCSSRECNWLLGRSGSLPQVSSVVVQRPGSAGMQKLALTAITQSLLEQFAAAAPAPPQSSPPTPQPAPRFAAALREAEAGHAAQETNRAAIARDSSCLHSLACRVNERICPNVVIEKRPGRPGSRQCLNSQKSFVTMAPSSTSGTNPIAPFLASMRERMSWPGAP